MIKERSACANIKKEISETLKNKSKKKFIGDAF